VSVKQLLLLIDVELSINPPEVYTHFFTPNILSGGRMNERYSPITEREGISQEWLIPQIIKAQKRFGAFEEKIRHRITD